MYFTMRHDTTVHYTNTTLHYTTSHYTTPHYTTLHYTTSHILAVCEYNISATASSLPREASALAHSFIASSRMALLDVGRAEGEVEGKIGTPKMVWESKCRFVSFHVCSFTQPKQTNKQQINKQTKQTNRQTDKQTDKPLL